MTRSFYLMTLTRILSIVIMLLEWAQQWGLADLQTLTHCFVGLTQFPHQILTIWVRNDEIFATWTCTPFHIPHLLIMYCTYTSWPSYSVLLFVYMYVIIESQIAPYQLSVNWPTLTLGCLGLLGWLTNMICMYIVAMQHQYLAMWCSLTHIKVVCKV